MVAKLTLRRESIKESPSMPVNRVEFEDGESTAVALSDIEKNVFEVETPYLTVAQYRQYRSHFLSSYAGKLSFEFDNPFSGETITVRYVPDSFQAAFRAGVVKASFRLEKVSS